MSSVSKDNQAKQVSEQLSETNALSKFTVDLVQQAQENKLEKAVRKI